MTSWSGWIPIGVDAREAQRKLVWFRLGDYRFDDPFVSDTIARCARHPFNLVFGRRTDLEQLEDAAADLPPARVSGIIFHMSRCGSTLVSRCLAAVPGTLAISEAPAIDAVARARRRDASVKPEQQVRWLRAIVTLFAAANGAHRNIILKLDAWHTLDLALFTQAFPDAAWIYVYRDPVEVLVSHAARMSYMMSAANAPDFLDMPLTKAVRLPRETYCAQVLGRINEAVLHHGVSPEALVRYDELPQAIWERVAPRFGMQLTPAEADAAQRRASYDAKNPQLLFQDDRAAKQLAANDAIRGAAATWIAPQIDALNQVRGGR